MAYSSTPAPMPPLPPLPAAPADAATLLIVDDMPENLAVLGQLLRDAGYRVRAANSGRMALQYVFQAPRPDLVLLDVMMPEMDGYAVLRRLKADPASSATPVILLTALADTADELHGFSEGAADYITKPYQPPIVLARVRTQLELKRARDLLQDHNVYLEAEVARRMAENERVQSVSITALANLAEARDAETGNHILRTQTYVHMLARRLQGHPRFAAFLTEDTIDLLTHSAPLHDIGKVGIPDHILLKPGALSGDEWVVMKTHAQLGAHAIQRAETAGGEPLPFLALAKEIARWHHERWDGSGYPDGLAGEAIPPAARLMAIADVFDALVSWRVYKNPFGADEARQLIAAGRGSHFDPDVADAFLGHYDDFAAIARRYADH